LAARSAAREVEGDSGMQTSEIQRLMADAVWHHQSGRLSDAERLYRQILTIQPGTGAALNNLGNALCDLGQLEEAEACFRQALALSPNDAEAHNNLGTLLHARQKLEAAEASYRQALALKLDLISAASNLGAVLWEQARPEEAAKIFRHALARAPRDSDALNGLGPILSRHGRRFWVCSSPAASCWWGFTAGLRGVISSAQGASLQSVALAPTPFANAAKTCWRCPKAKIS